jgi:hypothetical protein
LVACLQRPHLLALTTLPELAGWLKYFYLNLDVGLIIYCAEFLAVDDISVCPAVNAMVVFKIGIKLRNDR